VSDVAGAQLVKLMRLPSDKLRQICARNRCPPQLVPLEKGNLFDLVLPFPLLLSLLLLLLSSNQP